MKALRQSSVKWKGLLISGTRIFGSVAGICIVLIVLVYIFQPRCVYHPEHTLSTDPGIVRLEFEGVYFETADGVNLYGWFIPGPKSRGTVLLCHGIEGMISYRLASIKIFNRLGLDVFIFDYRGYGHSEGKPTEGGTYEDIAAAWRYLIEERQVSPGQVIVFGRSLGGAIASWLAQSQTPGMLIL